MRRLCFSLTLVALAVMLKHNLQAQDQPPFYLGGRASDDLPALSDEELGTPQQQALLTALAGDPYGHRECDHWRAGYAMDIRRRRLRRTGARELALRREGDATDPRAPIAGRLPDENYQRLGMHFEIRAETVA